MSTDIKPFSQEDYNKHDAIAKKYGAKFMIWRDGCELRMPIEDQPEYGPAGDVILYCEGEKNNSILIEAAHKNGWIDQGRWQHTFPTVDVESRRHKSKAKTFIMFNAQWDALAVTLMKNVHVVVPGPKPDGKAKCSNVTTWGELFFQVAIDKFRYYTVLNDERTSWKEITFDGRDV